MWIRRSKLTRLRQLIEEQGAVIKALNENQSFLNEVLAKLALEIQASANQYHTSIQTLVDEGKAERLRAMQSEHQLEQVVELMMLLEQALRRHTGSEAAKPHVLVPTYTSDQS